MLLVHARRDPRSRYSHYLGEILVMEGFTGFTEVDLDDLDDGALAGAGLVVLPRVSLTAKEAARVDDYVAEGGKLLAFHPDPYLGKRFGLAPAQRATPVGAGYLWIDTSDPMTAGLCPEPVQIIAPAVIWRPVAETAIAIVAHVSDATDPTLNAPGVVRVGHGKGEAILFAYDLPFGISRLRQGDPAYADLSLSGMDHFIRPHELFINQLPVRQQRLPQADVQTALLAWLIETLEPQPRLWYYPEATDRSILVMTSDDDWSTIEQFETLLAGLRKRDATCSFYMVQDTKISSELMTEWEADGHTFSVHPSIKGDYGTARPVAAAQPTFAATMVRDNVERHQREFGRPARTMRNHAIRWLGYVDMAQAYADLGTRLECNYVSVHPLVIGHLCGTGRPLRFVDTEGSLIDCYQQPTHWTEEALVHHGHSGGAHWQFARAIRETNGLIETAARTFYTPICLNSHPVSFATYSSPLIEANWDKAREEGLRIISADRWLDWTTARAGVRVQQDGGGWSVAADETVEALTLLYPPGAATAAGHGDFSEQVLWGRSYRAITLRGLAAGERRLVRAEAPMQ